MAVAVAYGSALALSHQPAAESFQQHVAQHRVLAYQAIGQQVFQWSHNERHRVEQ